MLADCPLIADRRDRPLRTPVDEHPANQNVVVALGQYVRPRILKRTASPLSVARAERVELPRFGKLAGGPVSARPPPSPRLSAKAGSPPIVAIHGRNQTSPCDQPERLEGRLIQSRRSLTRISLAATPSTFASTNRASVPCRSSTLDQLIWPIRVSVGDTRSHTAL